MLLIVLLVAGVTFFVMSDPRLRALVKEHPSRSLFLALCLGLLLVTAFRTGRPWLGLLATLAAVWGPRLLTAARVARKVSGGMPPRADAPHRPRRMTRREALSVLELSDDATRAEISRRYRQMMQTVHPDRGGSEELARKVNEAKSVLLD